MKIKTSFICNQCGHQTQKWVGKCPQCETWNSFTEEITEKTPPSRLKIKGRARSPQEYSAIIKNIEKETRRIETGISEFDQVLGGGFVPGSMNLLGGEPGIGKSTLTLQICEKISALGKNVLYFSGEESEDQIVMRAKRLNLKLQNFKILNETHLETILATLAQENPDFAVIDSIQTVFSENMLSSAGTISQVRLCTEALMEFAKPRKIPILIIGHVTKDGVLAGPKVLEHLVDGVFILEGDRYQEFRLLRGIKNRFGSTNEVGVFEMTHSGMQEVKNPSAKFLEEHEAKQGSALTCIIEGTRPFIIEVQALTSATRFGYPRRMTAGFDVNRLHLLIAVMERELQINLGSTDVYINVVAGLKITEPAADLSICLAILSSFKKKPLSGNTVFVGEVGLGGEIRKTSHYEKRRKEIEKLRLNIIPAQNMPNRKLKDITQKSLW